ncbi:MAG: hypothetical protein Q9193_002950, partial [Seirophora villosa]
MHFSSLPIALLLTWTCRVRAHPLYDLYNLEARTVNSTDAELVVRQAPKVPPKPETSGPGSFHGSQFDFLEENGYAPAIDAMPVWVYSTTEDLFSPCYPEGATKGNGPNPGTNVGAGASPGEDCTSPGPKSKSAYTLSNAFPTYISASWCGNVKEWRIQFYNYYVDVPGTTDVKNENTGLNKKHPKVYVGFFSHASFPEINTSRKTIFNGECPDTKDLLGNEY